MKKRVRVSRTSHSMKQWNFLTRAFPMKRLKQVTTRKNSGHLWEWTLQGRTKVWELEWRILRRMKTKMMRISISRICNRVHQRSNHNMVRVRKRMTMMKKIVMIKVLKSKEPMIPRNSHIFKSMPRFRNSFSTLRGINPVASKSMPWLSLSCLSSFLQSVK